MDVSIRAFFISPEIAESLRQMEDSFGAVFCGKAAAMAPFENFATLHIIPNLSHPMAGPRPDQRSHHKATNAYFTGGPVAYTRFASTDWTTRTSAYADAIERAIERIAKTRITPAERSALLELLGQTRAEIIAAPPPRVTPVKPIYVGAGEGMPLMSFERPPGAMGAAMTEIAPEHADQHQRPAPPEPRVFKRYKRLGAKLHYREAWITDDNVIVEHWGVCGERGETVDHACQSEAAARTQLNALETTARDAGFKPLAISRHATLLVEIPINGMGTTADLDRRHQLEDFLNEHIGWLGLGHVDGGSIGSGTMEACVLVVDFNVAKAVLEPLLRASPFSDFTRIYRE